MHYTTFGFMMSLLAMSLGLRFCASRKGWTGGGGWVSTLDPANMAASGLSCRKPLVSSTEWAISLLLCTNGLRKWFGYPWLSNKDTRHTHQNPPKPSPVLERSPETITNDGKLFIQCFSYSSLLSSGKGHTFSARRSRKFITLEAGRWQVWCSLSTET